MYRGVMRKKLENFLVFFQKGTNAVRHTVTFAHLHPKLKLCESFEEVKVMLDEVANELGGLDHEDEEKVEENDAPSALIFDDEQVTLLDKKQADSANTEEFDQEFAKMMTESLESRNHNRQGIIDVPWPLKKTATGRRNGTSGKKIYRIGTKGREKRYESNLWQNWEND
ncbi:hypothetical protein NEOLI_000143 [Neolecta irregularis DAH-3]|uniref:Up-frameshift suppressor 2 C-terminal domain-containing protein n=1 Tax=Neolecta irregularis (strain DAH-3) TaxID=1198029 RepID=A0A1U7LQV6_NEOID|nr:hypothetical protein NEOLI_000143 [Neolecta irregularis DAH-3]|eukprot:OLL25037.1 hypothetical protein NEOLI_000143 [Neolecta irregularis DAH-3]